MAISPPSTQKTEFRPISFVLDDQTIGLGSIGVKSVDLVIRPEELTRSDPSRVNVQQTLGQSPWADNFGPGLGQITISGHTGWRRTEGDSSDGAERFQRLNEQVFTRWHSRRREAALAGSDPDNVRLIFVDVLDGFSAVIVPTNFVLRRSRQRPLLCQYQISLTVIDESIDQLGYLSFGGVNTAKVIKSLGLTSLTDSISRITSYASNVSSFITVPSLVSSVRSFMNKTASIYQLVHDAISSGSRIADTLVSIAQMTARAGLNVFRTLAAVVSIPSIVRAQLMRVAGAYSNIFCVLRNALKQQLYYQEYSGLYGASNCSSTSGGRAISSYASANPFFSVVPTAPRLPVTVTADAQKTMTSMSAADPVLSPMSVSAISGAVASMAGGIVLA